MPNSDKYKLFRLKRKRDIGLKCVNKKQARNYDRTTITDIKDLGYKEEMTCFLVDNEEHLFLMNDFIVTHNTRVLTERIKDLILNKFVDPKQITVLVFTNLAAEEVKKRLGSIVNGAFIGTIHSYANQLCMANGISTSQAIEDRDFDVILKKALTIPKSKYPHIQHLLIDEAQDLGSLDFAFVERCHADNIFFVGDDRQAIYGFRGCSDKYIRYMKNDPDYTKFYLTEDFRNAPNILEFANDFLGSYRALGLEATAYKTEDGIVDECDIDEALSNLVSDGNWSSWFILTRTNNEILEIQEMLDEMQVPNVTFKRGDFDDLAQMDELIASNRVKVMTIHVSKGLEAKNVIVTGAKIFNEEERKIAYVAATRAENALYWCPSFSRFQKKGYKAHNGMKQNKIFDKADLEMIEF